MNQEIENLINMALADGEVTEKERAIILRKAESLGLDKDEVEMIIDARIHQLKTKSNESKRGNVNKCPSCGEIIHGLSQVCSSCGYLLKKSTVTGENSKDLYDSIHQLENFIIDIKSFPKPSFGEKIKIVVLTYFTLGLYLIYRKFSHKKGDSFDSLVAKCEKESRLIKVHYGEDRKVRVLLDELNGEIDKIGKERKKLSLRTNLGCFGLASIFIVLYVFMIFDSFNNTKEYLEKVNITPQENFDKVVRELYEGKIMQYKKSKNYISDSLIFYKIYDGFLKERFASDEELSKLDKNWEKINIEFPSAFKYYLLARKSIKEGDYNSSKLYSDTTISLFPNFAPIYFQLSNLKDQEFSMKLKYINKAIELDSDKKRYLYGRSYIYILNSMYIEGLDDIITFNQSYSDNIQSNLWEVIILHDLKRKDEACEKYSFVKRQLFNKIDEEKLINDPLFKTIKEKIPEIYKKCK